MTLGCEKWVFVSAYGPGSERSEQERDVFWEELNECLRGFDSNESIVLMGDLNARVGDREIDGVTGKFGVQGINDNGEKLIEVCSERNLIIGNTCFKKRMIHKYTWERVAHGRVVDRALMDFVIVSRRLRGRLLDVNVMRGAAGGMSDHYLVEEKMRVNGNYMRRKRRNVREVIKVNELEKVVCMREYEDKIESRWEERKRLEWEGVDEEWNCLRECMKLIVEEVCGKKRIGGSKRKGCEWWNESIERHVKEKKVLYERYLQERDLDAYERYKRKRNEVKRVIKDAKDEANERWGGRLMEDFERNKKMFWKEVRRVKMGEEKKSEKMKDANGNMLMTEEEVNGRWANYFESLLNVTDDREARVTAVGNGRRMPGGVKCDDEIEYEEVYEAVRKMKGGKSAGIDEIVAEYLKKGGVAMIEWLVRMFNGCFREGRIPREWKSACIVPIYKGKGDRCECSNYRGISLLSVVGKVYGRVMIERIMVGTDAAVGEEQCGFRKGRGCVDQIFSVRQVCEKYLSVKRDVYMAFMDLEKAYDRVDRNALWQVLRVYGVGGKLLKGVQSFYNESRACVRSESGYSEWFDVKVGLRQGCVMSPWLFNVYMDGVVREVNMRVQGRGLEMIDGMGRGWRMNQLLYADDTVLIDDSKENLQHLLSEFGRVCERRKLKVNVEKSKVMMCSRREDRANLNLSLNGKILEEVHSFKYLGATVSENGGVGSDVRERVNQGAKVIGAMKGVWKERALSTRVKRAMYEGIVVPTVLYGAETWGLNKKERKSLDVLEMRCLRSINGTTIRDRVRNEEVRRRTGVKLTLSQRVDRCTLRWFGHVERMNEERMAKKVYVSAVNGRRDRGRPTRVWMDGVKDALNAREVTLEQARMIVDDRDRWRDLVKRV